MLYSYNDFFIPVEMLTFSNYHLSDIGKNVQYTADIKIERDREGVIKTVSYYSDSNRISQKSYYKNNIVYKIDKYQSGSLYSTEFMENSHVIKKIYFKNNFDIDYELVYRYDVRDHLCNIVQKSGNEYREVEYEYDDIDRIVKRVISLNKDEYLITQKYSYDILNRIVQYEDNELQIDIKCVNRYNELVLYSIKNSSGDNIEIENIFDKNIYKYSNVMLNGHNTTIKNNKYVDNVLLHTPFPSENDLNLVLPSLIIGENNLQNINKDNIYDIFTKKDAKVLPISMRKFVLYKQALNM